MASIVLIHGIGQQHASADTLEAQWLPALAGGLRVAGYEEAADQLWRLAHPGGLDARMVYYGDLFRTDGAMGDAGEDVDELTDEQATFIDALAFEWLQAARDRGPTEEDRDEAATAIDSDADTADTGQAQGVRATARPVVNSLVRVPWFAQAGMGFAQRFVIRSLTQVTRYMTEQTLREQIQQRVSGVVGPDTRVIIGHSLGSVVAFEAAHRLDAPVPLLVTVGSPLGLRSIVYDRLPVPAQVPAAVDAWWNLVDRDDLVAAAPDLARGFADPAGKLHSHWTLNNGARPHDATRYLTQRQVGVVVGPVLAEG